MLGIPWQPATDETKKEIKDLKYFKILRKGLLSFDYATHF
jgi:hypothetical protein